MSKTNCPFANHFGMIYSNLNFMRYQHLFFSLILCTMACQQLQQEPGRFAEKSAAPTPLPDSIGQVRYTSAAAQWSALDSVRQFARTAELKGQVNEVLSATMTTEDIALRHGGFILSSQFSEVAERVNETALNADSMLQTTHFHQSSQLSLRVPVQRLDTVLRQIGQLATVLEHRVVLAEEVTLKVLREQLTRQREQQFQQELPTNDPQSVTNPAQLRRDSRLSLDESELRRLDIRDRVQYSLVTVHWRDHSKIRTAKLANNESAETRGNWSYRMAKAASGGWYLLSDLSVLVIYLWPIWLLLAIVWGVLRWRRKP
jgi:Domain of unknown function (DUF4349)